MRERHTNIRRGYQDWKKKYPSLSDPFEAALGTAVLCVSAWIAIQILHDTDSGTVKPMAHRIRDREPLALLQLVAGIPNVLATLLTPSVYIE